MRAADGEGREGGGGGGGVGVGFGLGLSIGCTGGEVAEKGDKGAGEEERRD